MDPRPRRSCSAWRRITAVWPSGPQRWLLWPVPQPRQRRLQWIQPPGARVRLIAGMGRPPRRSQNDDDLPTAMAFRIGLSRYRADFPRAGPGLCHQRKPGDGGRSAMPPAASRHFSSRLAERSSRGRGLFHEPVPQSLLVQLRSLRPDRRQVALPRQPQDHVAEPLSRRGDGTSACRASSGQARSVLRHAHRPVFRKSRCRAHERNRASRFSHRSRRDLSNPRTSDAEKRLAVAYLWPAEGKTREGSRPSFGIGVASVYRAVQEAAWECISSRCVMFTEDWLPSLWAMTCSSSIDQHLRQRSELVVGQINKRHAGVNPANKSELARRYGVPHELARRTRRVPSSPHATGLHRKPGGGWPERHAPR